MTEPCEKMHQMMAARLFGELLEVDGRQLDAHLADCPDCQIHWASLTESLDTLRHHSRPLAPEGLADRLLERLTPTLQGAAGAEPVGEDAVAEIAMVQGPVKRRAADGDPGEEIAEGESLGLGDIVEVGERGRALLRLPDRSELWLNAGTALRLISSATERAVHLIRGELLALVEKQRRDFRVLTAEGEIHVMGTVFSAWSQPGQATWVSVLSGRVQVSAAAHRRAIGAHRKVELSGQRGLGRTGRLSLAEVKRLSGWTGPIRPVSRASEGRALKIVRRRTVMNLLGKAALLIAGVIAATLILSLWRISTSPDIAEQMASAQTRIAAARPLDVVEPVSLAFEPSPGDAWSQTAYARCSALVQATNRVDERMVFDVRMVSEATVRAGSTPDERTVEHIITEADVEVGLWQGEDSVTVSLEEQARDMERTLRTMSVVETLDAQGFQQGLEIRGGDPENLGVQLVLPCLVATPAVAPAEPVSVGTSWTRDHQPLAFNFGVTESLSTLDRFEMLGEQRLAVVRSQGRLGLTSPTDLGVQRVTRPWMQMRLQGVLTECDLLWTQETRHLLDSGFPISTTIHIEQTFAYRASQIDDSPRPWRGGRSAQITIDSIAECERRP
jgi:FecR protein/Putative zinc-finger